MSWAPSAASGTSAIQSYTVTSSPSGATATVSGSGHRATVGGLANGTAHTFNVVATNAAASSPASAGSNAVTPGAASGGTPPSAPTDVNAVAGAADIVVTWQPPLAAGTSPVDGYLVSAAPGNQALTVAASAYSATLRDLSRTTGSTVSIVAISAAGNGPAASSARVRPRSDAPGAPAKVLATAGNSQVTVSRRAPASGGPVASYPVASSPGNATRTVSGDQVPVTGPANGQPYQFPVVAVAADGESSPAATSNTATPEAPSTATAPSLTGIRPARGTVPGGRVVTITGTNLAGATGVGFGGAAASQVTVVSAATLAVTSPAGAGLVDVTVTTPAATSAVTPADRFGYPAAAACVTRTLQPGWNTLSIPFALQQQTLSGIFHPRDRGSFLTGYADPSGRRQQVDLGTPSSVFAQPMTGLYVYVTKAVTVTLTPSSDINPPPALGLQPGRNLVGPSSVHGAQSYADFLGGVGSVLVDPHAGEVSSSQATDDATGLVTDGYAYWLYASQAGTLTGRVATPPNP